MGCDMVVALGQATAEGRALFGQNCHRATGFPTLQLVPGRDFALGEKTSAQWLELDQVRKTHTVLGSRPPDFWGYQHGLNEFHLALGCSSFPTKLHGQRPGLVGPDLVRLALERCRTARQAVGLVADLVERHGQGSFPGCPDEVEGDYGFLIADPKEAFAVETSGHFWVHQEVRQVRAVSDLCLIRQDWDRISHGLADFVIDRGWWPCDGSKVDFAGTLGMTRPGRASDLRRWGRATLLLEEQNGHIDHDFMRRLLGDHFDGEPNEIDPLGECTGHLPICRHSNMAAGSVTAASFIADLASGPADLPVLWCAFGPPCSSVYLPIFLEGDYPALLQGGTLHQPIGLAGRLQHLSTSAGTNRECLALVHHNLAQLQSQLDGDTEAFAAEAVKLKERRDLPELRRRIALFVEHLGEQMEKVIDQLEETTRHLGTRFEAASYI